MMNVVLSPAASDRYARRVLCALAGVLLLQFCFTPISRGAERDTAAVYRRVYTDRSIMQGGGQSELARLGAEGKLVYSRDADGNRLSDFSYAGYRGGGVAIPDVPVAVTVEPGEGDATRRIQAAVDRVGRMPMRADGFRGAVLLKKGRYLVSDTILIRHSGVVVRGEGAGFAGTWIYHRPTIKDNTPGEYPLLTQVDKGIVPTFETKGGEGRQTSKVAAVTSSLVVTGSDRLTLSDVSGLRPGMEVVIFSQQTRKWVDDLGLSDVWKPNFRLQFPRIIKEIDRARREIVLNVPVTSRIDIASGHAVAEVHVVTRDARQANVGLEDILFISSYDRSRREDDHFVDENHPNYVFRFGGVRDGWMRRCVAFFYSGGMVDTKGSQHLTIEDCAMLDGVSKDTPVNHAGARKYYFNAEGEMLLFQRNYARYARHAFVGNGTRGGAVWVDCFSERDHLKHEWHQRWGHGHLYDNISSEMQIGVSGNPSVHGQKAAFGVAWNNLINKNATREPDLYVNSLEGIFQNYAIGNILRGNGKIGNSDTRGKVGEVGFVESTNRFVEPRSLYLAQLRDRLGDEAVRAVATPRQITGPRGAVWMHLIEQFAHFPEWLDPEQAPWRGYESWMPRFEAPAASAAN